MDQALLDAVDAAILLSLQTGQAVHIGDRSWQSHEIDKLIDMRAKIAAALGAPGHARYRLAATSKGVT